MKKITSSLDVHALLLDVRLGEHEQEREDSQPVEVELSLRFETWPDACADDRGGFICYAKLAKALEDMVALREFRLIEFLAAELHAAVRTHLCTVVPELEPKTHVRVKVTKRRFPEAMPLQAASFTYSDMPHECLA